MRVMMIAALAMMASGLAQSAEAGTSSIAQITTSSGKTPSVRMITCTTCPSAETKKAEARPTLEAGTQKIELRTVNGKQQLVRTEAWLGGSPVVFINKQAGWLDNGSLLAGLTNDGVDTTTETAAVKHDAPVQDQAPAQDTMQLRLK